MKWLTYSLMSSLVSDDEVHILGQIAKDGTRAGWNAFNYSNKANFHLGYFDFVEQAKIAVILAVKARENAINS